MAIRFEPFGFIAPEDFFRYLAFPSFDLERT
jgi:hypothetical protein